MHGFEPQSHTAVCYVTDEKFLFLTIASAMSFRSFVPDNVADVIIFDMAQQTSNFHQVREACASMGIKLVSLSDAVFATIDMTKWNSTHISIATLGRFLIADVIASSYRKMLYVDGDTLFIADPTPLLRFDPGVGKIEAVDDIRSYARRDVGRYGTFTRSYFESLRITDDQQYFNGGLLLVQAKTWEMMARDAFSFFRENVEVCKFHDQSAMNSVLGRHRTALPIAWNFQAAYKFLGLERKISPKIYHFTESTNSWLAPLLPWKRHNDYYLGVKSKIGSIVPRVMMSRDHVVAQNKRTTGLLAKCTSCLHHAY